MVKHIAKSYVQCLAQKYTDKLNFLGGGPTPCVMRDLSFLTMDRTTIPAVAAWSLNHWAAREVLRHVFLYFF